MQYKVRQARRGDLPEFFTVLYVPPFCMLGNLINGDIQGQTNHSKPSTALSETLKRLFCGKCVTETEKFDVAKITKPTRCHFV